MKTNNTLIPIILCGGTGTRLWPLSRASYPKQFWNLNGDSDSTLLQETYLRLLKLKEISTPFLICNQEHRFIVAEQMRAIGTQPKGIFLEPIGKNTAPAIAIAALQASQELNDPLLLVLSSDHVINDAQKFHEVIEEGKNHANNGRIVTFGVIPTSPETGYGYIEAEKSLDYKSNKGVPISRFVEKPDKKTAENFIADKRFLWNSGIFLFKASTIINELERLQPQLLNSCRNALNKKVMDLDFFRLDEQAFSSCPSIAIDEAVMEKTNLGTVLPLDAGWSDIGNWYSLWEVSNKDKNGNFLKGNIISEKNKNCYIRSENRLVVGIGIENLVIVETDDAILISQIKESQKVKKIVSDLNSMSKKEGSLHRKIYRPWGNYIIIAEGKRWQVKRIQVHAGASLSLQMHHHRAEHWIVVKGTALVEIDKKKKIIGENESVYIPLGIKHRLTNEGKSPVELIEVQSGSYLGEDDIIRFEDNYQRLNNTNN